MPHTPSNEEMNAAKLLFNSFSTTYMPFVKGDIIVNGSSKRKVLATLESLVFLSDKVEFITANPNAYTQQQLTKAGWKTKVKDWKPVKNEEYFLIDTWGDILATRFGEWTKADVQFVQPTEEQKAVMQNFRDKYEALLVEVRTLPMNRGLSIAVTKLEESAMWLNKSITNNC